MALELGLKLTRTRAPPENATSVSELRISKNTAGPVFVSTETHSSFILTCYLKGYDRNSFQIKISEDGKEISISGKKPVQEMLMMGRVMLKKNVQISGFRKVFEIPDGVVLDRIKAKFDEDESLLKIVMPKLAKGICGVQIEEMKKEGFGESSQNASETGENECVYKKEGGLSDKRLEESTIGDVNEGPRFEATKESELGENADHIPENIGGERPEVLQEPVLQPLEESENIMLSKPPGTTREDEFEGTPKEETGEFKFGTGGDDEEKVPTEMSKNGLGAIETSKEGGEFKKVNAGKIGISGDDKAAEIEQGEVKEPKSETEDRGEQSVKDILVGKDEERVGAKIRKEGVEALDTAMEGRNFDKVLAGAFGTSEEGILEGTQKKENKENKFGSEGKDEERARKEISEGGLEAIHTTMERRESEKELAGAIEVDENKQRGVEKAELKTEGKDEEREGREITKEDVEAIETRIDGVEPKKVHGENIEREGVVKGIKQKEIEDKDKERVKDIVGGRQKKDIQKLEPETGGRGEERLGTETKRGLEAIESKLEGGEFKKVLVGKIGVGEEDIIEGTEQRETDGTKFDIEDIDQEKLEEVLEGTQDKEIGKNEFAIEGGVSEKMSSDVTGFSGKDIVEGTKKGEIGVPKFENENSDEKMLKEKISDEDFEGRKTKIKGSPMEESKLPIQLGDSEGTFEGIERVKDKREREKLKIEEPKFRSVEENSKTPKCATSKGENLEDIGETRETMAKRRSQEAEGISEKDEGEEPKKMSKETRKVNGNDYARDSGKKEIEESAIRSSRNGHVQENNVSKVFEELGTDTAKFPKRMSETKAQREKEVRVKEEIIVKREKEVKVKEVIVNKYDAAKEGFDKATTADRIQLETGQPRDGRGFDEETSEAAKLDKTKALKEGSVSTEPSLEKVKGGSNDNVKVTVFSPLMNDDKRERTERTQKVTEDPKIATKHKAQHCAQELPMKIAESMDEMEGPKDTKTGEMEDAKRKSEEPQVVADEESTIEEKIREAELERIMKTNQFEKSLQELPEAKDRQALEKGMREIESMRSTQQLEVKEIDKVCEDCKRSEADLERDKWRTDQSVKDDKLRREDAVKQVEESMQKAPEKEHPGKSEVEEGVTHIEAKVVYPGLRKEVETKNEVEGSRLKEKNMKLENYLK